MWDVGFGIGSFGIQVWDGVIWDTDLGLGYLGYRFWVWVIWDIGFGIWDIFIVTNLERNTHIYAPAPS